MSSEYHKQILVIENDGNLREALQMILENDQCLVHACDIRHTPDDLYKWDPVVAIVDIPYKSFTHTVHKIIAAIKQQTNNRVAILLTSTDARIETIAQELGANDFLEEPFDVSNFLTKIHQLFNSVTDVTEKFGNKAYTIDVP